MEIILSYLDSMFAQLPNTEEVMRAKEEMASMMEDKYTELKTEGNSENEAIGIVISEFGNIDELIRELDLEQKHADIPAPELKRERKNLRRISRQTGETYMADMKIFGRKIARSTALCICSPILLILSAGWYQTAISGAIGLIVLLGMIAVAVIGFIVNGVSMQKYEYLQKEPFELEADAKAVFEQMSEEFRPIFAKKIAAGVTCFILGVLPVIVAATAFGEEETGKIIFTVGLLLLFVALGVYIVIRAGMENSCFDVLLQKGEYSVERKGNNLIEKIAAIYWPVVTAIYLGWSFVSGDWGSTWIIWPVTGALFGGISAICTLIPKNQSDR